MNQVKDTHSRREFLQASAAASLIGYSAVQSATISATAQSTEGNQYRIGVIGSTGHGNYGHGVDTAWRDFPNCEIVGIADDNEKGRARAAERHNVKDTFADYSDMLDKTKPDIVSICPDVAGLHRDMAIAAAERGIHIYLEKPFVPTLVEADEVVAACDKYDVKLALALWSHYSPKLHRLKQLIEDGAIGRVLEYRARGKEDGRGGAEDLYVLGIHVLDMIRVLGGHPKWCFAHMSTDGQPVTKQDVITDNEDIGILGGNALQAMWGMPDASTAYFGSHREASDDSSRFALQILGSEGILEIREGTMPDVKYLADPSWSPGRSGAQWQDVSSAGIGIPEPLKGRQYEARHALAIRDLLNAIENDRQPLCNAHEARAVVEMILSVFESHRLGKPVSLPLETRVHPFTMPFSV